MIRVMLVDDQAMVRTGFRLIIESEPGFTVVGEAADGREAVEMVEMEERAPQSSQSVDVEVRDYEPLRRYEQYVSPRAA